MNSIILFFHDGNTRPLWVSDLVLVFSCKEEEEEIETRLVFPEFTQEGGRKLKPKGCHCEALGQSKLMDCLHHRVTHDVNGN